MELLHDKLPFFIFPMRFQSLGRREMVNDALLHVLLLLLWSSFDVEEALQAKEAWLFWNTMMSKARK